MFKHKAAYQVWHELIKKNWKTNEDLYISALELLNRARIDGGVGLRSHEIRIIGLGSNDGYDSLAISIPAILSSWGCRIRELVLDSACEYHFLFEVELN